jgi:hypothetical protein
MRHQASILDRIPRHEDLEVIGKGVDNRAAHATAGGVECNDQGYLPANR